MFPGERGNRTLELPLHPDIMEELSSFFFPIFILSSFFSFLFFFSSLRIWNGKLVEKNISAMEIRVCITFSFFYNYDYYINLELLEIFIVTSQNAYVYI